MTKPPIDSREFALLLADFKLCDENKMGKEIKTLFDYLDANLAEAYEQGKKENNTELERLTECLKKENAQAEHFERLWYLQKDATEWQPIETAPKDGEFLGCRFDNKRNINIFILQNSHSENDYFVDMKNGFALLKDSFVYWAPLPKEPT